MQQQKNLFQSAQNFIDKVRINEAEYKRTNDAI